MKAFVYLVFPNSVLSVLPRGSKCENGELMENGIITSVTHGAMSGISHIYDPCSPLFSGLFVYVPMLMLADLM